MECTQTLHLNFSAFSGFSHLSVLKIHEFSTKEVAFHCPNASGVFGNTMNNIWPCKCNYLVNKLILLKKVCVCVYVSAFELDNSISLLLLSIHCSTLRAILKKNQSLAYVHFRMYITHFEIPKRADITCTSD